MDKPNLATLELSPQALGIALLCVIGAIMLAVVALVRMIARGPESDETEETARDELKARRDELAEYKRKERQARKEKEAEDARKAKEAEDARKAEEARKEAEAEEERKRKEQEAADAEKARKAASGSGT